ncbi:hypothetical protein DesfrDRAFT_3306 [Solidesulfovibrio fructosivorans JJ]]|uniref:Uncharacterized protein n=1 Tax=Solidesulfovibrio fructosivorans JJ] TaxID=596151 RepID=E1K0A6_SOLFR|nr:hypothetical protein [Solidesulfovibrio fructosivorans]EFL49937.1 hypothetical protein DesfrDRAFT_3306 [Solidesulfovibrio fructosivorans JJ]]
MIQPTLSTLFRTAVPSSSFTMGNRDPSTSSAASGDTVTFSQEALAKSRENVEQSDTADTSDAASVESPWKTQYDLEEGTVTLGNGHKQKTTIKGSKMEILEYDGSKLVRKETGSIVAGTVTRDIEEFDKRGKLSSRVHTELYAPEGGNSTHTRSTLQRDIQWFKNGNITRELHDSMEVDASYYSNVKLHDESIGNADTLEDLAVNIMKGVTGNLTSDLISKNYSADIIEYNDNQKISRTTSISQTLRARNETNRMTFDTGEAINTTKEIKNITDFSVSQSVYDNDGNIVSQGSFKDTYVKGVSQSQQLDFNQYNKGELVQQSHAEATQQATSGHRLPKRPDILEALSLTEQQYSATTPLGAQTLLADGKEKQVENPASLVDATLGYIADGNFNSAKNTSRGTASDVPHSSSWENTLYQDGKKVLQQRDSEVVRENPLPDFTGFMTVTGLTEDQDAVYLRNTSHSVETYKDGLAVDNASVDMDEASVDDTRGLTHTETNVHSSSTTGGKRKENHMALADSLVNVDNNSTASTKKVGSKMQMLLDNVLSVFQGFDDASEKN